jgi:DNA polymerase III subunit gamma/tau
MGGLMGLKEMAQKPLNQQKTEETKTTEVAEVENANTSAEKIDFTTAWAEFVDGLRITGKRSLMGLFEKANPEVKNENTFILHAPNKVVADMLEDERQDMMLHLRRRTGNSQLNMQIEIVQTENDIMPYTNREKFDSMVQKNPKLMDLKNALDLEIE